MIARLYGAWFQPGFQAPVWNRPKNRRPVWQIRPIPFGAAGRVRFPQQGDFLEDADLREARHSVCVPPGSDVRFPGCDSQGLRGAESGVSRIPWEPQGVNVGTIAPASDGPLTQEHRRELALATERAKRIRKAARVAAFNGWMTGIFAVASAPFAPFSMAGFLVTVGLALIAYNEFQGRKRLLQFDPSASTLLGWNQVAFLTLIIVYCLWMLFTCLTGAGPFAAEIEANPEIAAVLGSLDEFDYLYKVLVVAVYGTVIVLSAVFQGLNALYYFTRRKHVEAYVQETPDWVLDLQRMTTPP